MVFRPIEFCIDIGIGEGGPTLVDAGENEHDRHERKGDTGRVSVSEGC